VLYVTKNGDYNDAKKTVAARDETIKTQNDEKTKLQADLKSAQQDLENTKRDLGGAQGQADELKRQKQVISKCISLLGEAGQARAKGDTATADAKEKEADPVCDEAGRYLD
jgi:septal ring factor EnvC (AmiA/AmiB activator)